MFRILNKDYLFTFTRIWNYLSRRKKQISFLIFLIILAGSCEVFSFAALIPFLAIIASPDNFLTNPSIASILNIFGFNSPNKIVFIITICFIIAVLLSGCIRTLNLWLSNRLAALIGNDLSCKSFKSSLLQPYNVQAMKDSSEVISIATINSEELLLQLLTLFI